MKLLKLILALALALAGALVPAVPALALNPSPKPDMCYFATPLPLTTGGGKTSKYTFAIVSAEQAPACNKVGSILATVCGRTPDGQYAYSTTIACDKTKAK